jgi:lipopolysaccharide transport system permease protein
VNKAFSHSPIKLMQTIVVHSTLISDLVKREAFSKYKGSYLGYFWSFVTPVFMLTIYTLVFSEIFKVKWSNSQTPSKLEFAFVLFSGLIAFNFFAECFARAPNLVVSQPNFVKKVIFPLEILPLVALLSSALNALIAAAILSAAQVVLVGSAPAIGWLFWIALIPLAFISLGMMWLLSSLGVYVRDISQVIGIVTTALMFMTPIFFPLEALPIEWRALVLLNPLTIPVEAARGFLVLNMWPDWYALLWLTLWSALFAWAGFIFFQKTRRGFADVL